MLRAHAMIASATAASVVALAPIHAASGHVPASAPAPVTATRGPVPPGFRAQSQDWISSDQGFVLGTAPCGDSDCTTVIGTPDAGETWSSLGTIDAGLGSEEKSSVASIRFADADHGWAFGPALYATTDGGSTWTREALPGDGVLVLTLGADATAAYLAVAPCQIAPRCHRPATLWKSTPEDGSWHRTSLSFPDSGSAVLAMHGQVAYLMVPINSYPDPDLLFATVDGSTWSPRPVPCKKARDESLVDIAPVSDTEVALLCVADPGFSQSVKRVFRSYDTGMTTESAGMAPLLGITSFLAAAPDGTLALASFSDGSWIYLNTGGKVWAIAVADADGGQGWNDPVFTTDRAGYIVYSPAGYPWRIGQVWRTTDGGVSWSPLPLADGGTGHRHASAPRSASEGGR